MPHNTEFPYFVPNSSAPNVTRANLRVETHREDDILSNYYLCSVSLERNLVFWVNPEGPRPARKPVIYWYPRVLALAALAEMEESPDIITYRSMCKELDTFSEFITEDFKKTERAVFSPKPPR